MNSSSAHQLATINKVLEPYRCPFQFSGELESIDRLPEWLRALSESLQPLIECSILSLKVPVHYFAVRSWIQKNLKGPAERWWQTTTQPAAGSATSSTSSSVSSRAPSPAPPPPGGRRFESLDEIVEAFKKQFYQFGTKEKAIGRFKTITLKPGEALIDFHSRFGVLKESAGMDGSVNKFVYHQALTPQIQVQLDILAKERYPGVESGATLLNMAEVSLADLQQLGLEAEHKLRQTATINHSSASVRSGAGYHHAAAVPSQGEHMHGNYFAQEVLDEACYELNAMAGQRPHQRGDYRRSHSEHRGRGNSFSSSSHQGSGYQGQQRSYGNNNPGGYRATSTTSRGAGPPRGDQQSQISAHLTRGNSTLTVEDRKALAGQLQQLRQQFPQLRVISDDVLMSRIKYQLCGCCGRRTKADHTTASCRTKSHLN